MPRALKTMKEITLSVWRGLGVKPQAECRLASPAMKQTGQESGGGLCNIFKFWSFLQTTSASGGLRLRDLHTGFALAPNWGTSVSRTPSYIAPYEKSWRRATEGNFAQFWSQMYLGLQFTNVLIWGSEGPRSRSRQTITRKTWEIQCLRVTF